MGNLRGITIISCSPYVIVAWQPVYRLHVIHSTHFWLKKNSFPQKFGTKFYKVRHFIFITKNFRFHLYPSKRVSLLHPNYAFNNIKPFLLLFVIFSSYCFLYKKLGTTLTTMVFTNTFILLLTLWKPLKRNYVQKRLPLRNLRKAPKLIYLYYSCKT